MLYWAAVFFVIALVAALLGFTGIAVGLAAIAKILDHGLVRVHRGFKSSVISADLIVLLLGHITFLYELRITPHLFTGIVKLRRILGEICLGLPERGHFAGDLRRVEFREVGERVAGRGRARCCPS